MRIEIEVPAPGGGWKTSGCHEVAAKPNRGDVLLVDGVGHFVELVALRVRKPGQRRRRGKGDAIVWVTKL